MSAPQDNGTTNAGADPESTSQTADDTPPPSTQGLPPLPQPGYRSPDDPIGNPDPIPIGYFLDPNAPPGTYDHIPGIYSRQSMQERSDILFKEMLRRFEQATDEADEAARTIATELLRWSGLPLLFRAFAHVVLTYGPHNGLYHARQAVANAQEGSRNLEGPRREAALGVLAAAEDALQDVLDSGLYDETETSTGEDAETA